MIQNVLFWIPILLLILFIIIKKKYKNDFENLNENLDIIEKFLIIIILSYYFYKGIHIGLIMVMVTIILYIFTPTVLDGFREMNITNKQLGDFQYVDIVDSIKEPNKKYPRESYKLGKRGVVKNLKCSRYILNLSKIKTLIMNICSLKMDKLMSF